MKVQQHRIKYYVLGFYLLLLAVWQGLFSAQLLPDYLVPFSLASGPAPLGVGGR